VKSLDLMLFLADSLTIETSLQHAHTSSMN